MKQKTGDAVRLLIALGLAVWGKQFFSTLPPEVALLVSVVVSYLLTMLGSFIVAALFARPWIEIDWTSTDTRQVEDGRLELRRAGNATAAQIYEIRVRAKSDSALGKSVLTHLGNTGHLALEIKISSPARFARERTGSQLNDDYTVITLPLTDAPVDGTDWTAERTAIQVDTGFLNYKRPIKYRFTLNGEAIYGLRWIRRETAVRQLLIKDNDA